jgi:hypothetical protein
VEGLHQAGWSCIWLASRRALPGSKVRTFSGERPMAPIPRVYTAARTVSSQPNRRGYWSGRNSSYSVDRTREVTLPQDTHSDSRLERLAGQEEDRLGSWAMSWLPYSNTRLYYSTLTSEKRKETPRTVNGFHPATSENPLGSCHAPPLRHARARSALPTIWPPNMCTVKAAPIRPRQISVSAGAPANRGRRCQRLPQRGALSVAWALLRTARQRAFHNYGTP